MGKVTFGQNQTDWYFSFTDVQPFVCKINHFNSRAEVYVPAVIQEVQAEHSRSFLQDGNFNLSELCKPAVLVWMGSALESSVLGICLIHLSKSLGWIYIRCQVPVVIATFWEEEKKKTGKFFKCKKKNPIKAKTTPPVYVQHDVIESSCNLVCSKINGIFPKTSCSCDRYPLLNTLRTRFS